MAKQSEPTLNQIKKRVEQVKDEKKEIEQTLETYEKTNIKTIKNMDWFLMIVVVAVMGLGAVERNKILLLIGGLGFILLMLKIIHVAVNK